MGKKFELQTYHNYYHTKRMDIYQAIVIYRAPSSGSENRSQRCFKTLEGASKWMKEHFEGWAEDLNYPEEWDEEDMKSPFPSNEIFSVENLLANLEKNKKSYYTIPVWGPESEYEAQVPVEYHIIKTKLYE